MIDLNSTLARLGNDRELLRETAQFLVEDVPRLLEDVDGSLRKGDARATARAVHSLKGLALSFGDDEAVEAAELVESAVRAGSLSADGGEIEVLRSRFRQLASTVRDEVLGETGLPAQPSAGRVTGLKHEAR